MALTAHRHEAPGSECCRRPCSGMRSRRRGSAVARRPTGTSGSGRGVVSALWGRSPTPQSPIATRLWERPRAPPGTQATPQGRRLRRLVLKNKPRACWQALALPVDRARLDRVWRADLSWNAGTTTVRACSRSRTGRGSASRTGSSTDQFRRVCAREVSLCSAVLLPVAIGNPAAAVRPRSPYASAHTEPARQPCGCCGLLLWWHAEAKSGDVALCDTDDEGRDDRWRLLRRSRAQALASAGQTEDTLPAKGKRGRGPHPSDRIFWSLAGVSGEGPPRGLLRLGCTDLEHPVGSKVLGGAPRR
jgi:hypothetical protein